MDYIINGVPLVVDAASFFAQWFAVVHLEVEVKNSL